MIKVLDKQIADKIAAGEVIERPISIVKELVENAVDAGADSIVVEIKHGGKTYIRVTDNGCGIPQEEVETAFLRHATSKIEKVTDLDAIGTLGFRGEALASIAAVTRTELITKPSAQKTGKRVVIQGGNVMTNEHTGCPDGTTIVVTDLFYNTPARLKFMKADSAESGLI
ncbi:MAG: ATP-binding protein, partial [Firmicutes bacterium]|nr:ATP-binding protein [Bacillota bacterium]